MNTSDREIYKEKIMKTVNFTALEAGEHITKPINETLVNEVAKVRALFGDRLDFYWEYTAINCSTDDALSAWLVGGSRSIKVTVYNDGTSAFIG